MSPYLASKLARSLKAFLSTKCSSDHSSSRLFWLPYPGNAFAADHFDADSRRDRHREEEKEVMPETNG